MGYLVAVILEYTVLGYEYFTIASTLGYLIGSYSFAISATKEIQCILKSINYKAHGKKKKSNKLRAVFLEYVLAHATIKQLSML